MQDNTPEQPENNPPEPPQQTPPQAPPPPDPYNLGPTSLGMAAHVVGALCYAPAIGWIIALIAVITEKNNLFVKFHAVQALSLFVVSFLLYFVLGMLVFPGVFLGGGLFLLLYQLIGLGLLVVMIIMIVQAAQGKWYRLPIIGDFAAKQVGV
jgi:uncharacterized membrane protein